MERHGEDAIINVVKTNQLERSKWNSEGKKNKTVRKIQATMRSSSIFAIGIPEGERCSTSGKSILKK